MNPSTARTVLGDVRSDALGRVNYHEHFFQVSPLLPGDELDDEHASTTEAADLRAGGTDAVVDATPIGLGRDPEALGRLAAATGLHIVATTGVHRPAHYASDHWIHDVTEQDLADLLVADVEVGCPLTDSPRPSEVDRTSVRAGLLKVGLDYWEITPLARRAIAAIGVAHRRTGAPVMVHLEHCSAAHEALDELSAVGVPATVVVLAHVDRVCDPGLHLSLAERGAYLGYDGCARLSAIPESAILECLADVFEGGGGSRVLMGGDVARSTRYLSYGGMPGLRYLADRFLPRVRATVGDRALSQILVTNPSQWLATQYNS